MTLRLLLLYPLKSFGSIGEPNIGVYLVDASALHIDNMPDIEEFGHAPISVSDCLPVNVEVAVFFNIHRSMPSNVLRAYTYLIQSSDVERPHLPDEVLV